MTATYPTSRALRPLLSATAFAALLVAVTGCDTRGGTETGVVGRNCTVELRPIRTSETEVLHKQRSGRLEKLTADWVVVNESGNEIWIPRDMVLELRMDAK